MSTTLYTLRNRSLKKYTSDAAKVGDLLITIDWESLARQIGAKAAFNRNGRSRALNGAIVVKFKEANK